VKTESTNRPLKALDLFCRDGGAAVGLFNAGFEVVGVDKLPRKDYPFEYIQKDVFDLDLEFLKSFDFIWSSPPCQAYSFGTKWVRNKGKEYPDLVEPTRELLKKVGKPFVIENVPGAPIRKDLVLCGEMFDLNVLRHRYFEIHNFHVPQLKHPKHHGFVGSGEKIGVFNGQKNRKRFMDRNPRYTVAGRREFQEIRSTKGRIHYREVTQKIGGRGGSDW